MIQTTDKPDLQQGPLAGIMVVDLSRVLAGPYCTMMMGDLGATVIKVEHPGEGDDTRHFGPPYVAGESAYYLGLNRNKYGITLDFGTPEGKEQLLKLIKKADILVQNFRPGSLDRKGLGYEDLHAIHPGLIYCSISGYRHTGPRRELPGYDYIALKIASRLRLRLRGEPRSKRAHRRVDGRRDWRRSTRQRRCRRQGAHLRHP